MTRVNIEIPLINNSMEQFFVIPRKNVLLLRNFVCFGIVQSKRKVTKRNGIPRKRVIQNSSIFSFSFNGSKHCFSLLRNYWKEIPSIFPFRRMIWNKITKCSVFSLLRNGLERNSELGTEL
jgi:hypothetical protein